MAFLPCGDRLGPCYGFQHPHLKSQYSVSVHVDRTDRTRRCQGASPNELPHFGRLQKGSVERLSQHPHLSEKILCPLIGALGRQQITVHRQVEIEKKVSWSDLSHRPAHIHNWSKIRSASRRFRSWEARLRSRFC